MKTKFLFALTAFIFLSACEVYMAPSNLVKNVFKSESDSEYYRNRARILVKKLAGKVEEYEINKVAVIDLVDEKDRTPILGSYFAQRLVEEITHDQSFRVAQKGEVQEVLTRLDLQPALFYAKEETREIGEALKAQALVNGKITDLGTNLDVQLVMVDIATGEVIASATEPLNRTRFAVEMLRHF
ncbi:MAG: FlgO family outer membrane protein [Nitrospinales bacterium]